MPIPSHWLIWQLVDSAFPTGGFAHSGGLEAAWQQGQIRSRNDLTQFFEASLIQTARATFPFVNAGFSAPEAFLQLDRHCDVFLSNHVANRASRAQGRAMAFACGKIFPRPPVMRLLDLINTQNSPGHLAPVFGTIARALDLDHPLALRMFAFFVLRGLTSASVRLGIVGPMEAQALQSKLADFTEEICALHSRQTVLDAANTAPVLDILHAAHDRLYSRLFQT